MNQPKKSLIIWLALTILIASACITPLIRAPATPIPGLPYTLAARTIMARAMISPMPGSPTATATITATSMLPPTWTPTESPIPPSPTATATQTTTPTNTLIPPLTPIPTNTSVPVLTTVAPIPTSGGGGGGGGGGGTVPTSTPKPTATPTPPCNAAKLIRHVTIPHGLVLAPSTTFRKIWRIQNVGSCTWDDDYKFFLDDGDAMGGASFFLSTKVKPGETVDIRVDMIAPLTSGTYKGQWMLKTGTKVFGDGEDNDPFEVKITVMTTPSGTIFNFADEFCMAQWKNEKVLLPCPGKVGNRAGFAVRKVDPKLETGPTTGIALWTHPQMTSGGIIQGTYPAFTIQPGDRFIADLGCMKDYERCDVTFKLYYRILEGNRVLLGEWDEEYDATTTHIDIDLTPLVGQQITFVFFVVGHGPGYDNAAVWFMPQIWRP